MVSQHQQVIRVKIENAVRIVQAIPGSELCAISQDDYTLPIKGLIGIRLPVDYTCGQAQKVINKVLGKPVEKKPKLQGLHSLLCPELIYLGFKVFTNDRINLICSVTNTGSFTNPSSTPNKAAKKAESLLPLSLYFWIGVEMYEFYLFVHSTDNIVYGWWKEPEGTMSRTFPVWQAVQEFERFIRSKYSQNKTK